MEAAPEPPRLDRLLRFPVPQGLRYRYLPRREQGLPLHRLVSAEDVVPLPRVRETGSEPRLFRCLSVHMDQHVLEVRLLAPDAVDAHAAGDVADQPESRPCFHRLLLPCVTREHHLRPVALG